VEPEPVNHDDLYELTDRQERVRKNGRRHIAREFHDEQGQYFLAPVDFTVKNVRTIISNRHPVVLEIGLLGIRGRIGMLNGEFPIESGNTETARIFVIPCGQLQDLSDGHPEMA
jgi:signal transduction histidine kinase